MGAWNGEIQSFRSEWGIFHGESCFLGACGAIAERILWYFLFDYYLFCWAGSNGEMVHSSKLLLQKGTKIRQIIHVRGNKCSQCYLQLQWYEYKLLKPAVRESGLLVFFSEDACGSAGWVSAPVVIIWMWCVLYFPFLPIYVPANVALLLVIAAAFWRVEAYEITNWAEMHAGKLRQLRGKEFQLLMAEHFSGSFASGNKMPAPS